MLCLREIEHIVKRAETGTDNKRKVCQLRKNNLNGKDIKDHKEISKAESGDRENRAFFRLMGVFLSDVLFVLLILYFLYGCHTRYVSNTT